MSRKQFAMVMMLLWLLVGYHVGGVVKIGSGVLCFLYSVEVAMELWKERRDP